MSYISLGIFVGFTLLSVWGIGNKMESKQIILFCLDDSPITYVI